MVPCTGVSTWSAVLNILPCFSQECVSWVLSVGKNLRVSVDHLPLYPLILFSFYLILYVTGIVCDFETLCDIV